MHYFRDVTDLEPGEAHRLSIGEHLTFTDAAQRFQISRSSLIKVLLHLNLCQKEYDKVAGEFRHRLHPEAVKKGMGCRIMGKHGPFDVLSPITLEWLEEDLKALLSVTELDRQTVEAFQALREFEADPLLKMDLEGKVYWLTNRFPMLQVRQMAKGLGVSERVIHRYLARRRSQLERASAWKRLPKAEASGEPEVSLREPKAA
jgi:predicted DNA-binding protein (UPF0251 family)